MTPEQEKELIEQWAEIEHTRWSKWQAYLHSRLYTMQDRNCCHDHLKILPTELWQRWERQIKTPYSELSEAEKESDRDQVRPYLPFISDLLTKEREKHQEDIEKAVEEFASTLRALFERGNENTAMNIIIDKSTPTPDKQTEV